MANNKSLLQILMEQAGKVAKPIGSAVGQSSADITSILGSLLGISVPQQSQQQPQQQAQPTGNVATASEPQTPIPGQPEKMPSMKETFESQLNPLQENVWKTVKKVQKDQITEAMQMGVPAENILDQTGLNQVIANSMQPMINKTPASSPFGFGGATLQDGQVTEQQPGFLAALLSTVMTGNPKTAANMDLNRLGVIQELAGQQPLQKAKKEEIGLTQEANLEQLATEYGYKTQIEALKAGLDPNNSMVQGQILANDITNLVDVYNSLNLKGGLLGGAGAVGGQTGYQRDKRKEFMSASDSLVYSVASIIAGQEGRALSDRDIKLVSSWAKFKIGDREGDFRGKLENLVKKARARGINLPDVNELLNKKKQSNTAISSGNIKSITPVGE